MSNASLVSWVLGSSGAPALALVVARALGLAWTAPALSASGFAWRYRIALAALLAGVLAPVVGPALAAPAEPWALGRWCLIEAGVGAALGWSAALIVAAARQAGEIVGAQAGLSPAALLDPDAGEDLTPLGHLYGLIALGLFLALDGPMVTVRALVESYRVVPAGTAALSAETARLAFGRVGEALALALRASAPTALALTLAGVALGLVSRAAPALPLAALALPVRAMLGLVLVGLGLATLAATLAAAWGGWPGGG